MRDKTAFHPAMLGLQLVKRHWAKAMFAAQISRRQTSLLRVENRNNLRVGEAALSHSPAPSGSDSLYITLREFLADQVTPSRSGRVYDCPFPKFRK